MQVDPPIAGRLGVRGHSGHPFRWGEGWFEALRDGGVGWEFERNDDAEIVKRIDILTQLFKRDRSRTLALADEVLQLQDASL